MLMDLDVDIRDAVLFKKLPTLLGHGIAIHTGERSGNHLYPLFQLILPQVIGSMVS
jgi:hypothetical protein